MIHGLGADLRLAARRLRATPLFTIFAILSLGVGVGVTTTVYSVVDSTLWRDTVVRQPEDVAFVMVPGGTSLTMERMSRPDYEDLRATVTSFSGIGASRSIYTAVSSPSATELMPGDAVDGDYFRTLGVRAAVGRTIQPSDRDARVVVLSHAVWRTRFSADPEVIGRTVRLSGEAFEIIGVAQESFEGPHDIFRGARLWVPLGAAPVFLAPRAAGSTIDERDRRTLFVAGRLASGRTVANASAEIKALAANLDAAHPQRSLYQDRRVTTRQWSAKSLAQIRADSDGGRRIGLLLVALIALVLVVACTNLANLVLARGTARQHELAVRAALGASRWRLIREQFAESALLALGGAIASFLVVAGFRALLDIDLPFAGQISLTLRPSLNVPSLAVASAAVLLSLLVFGLEPAVQLTRRGDVRNDLSAGTGSVGLPRAGRQRTLLRWQVAISAGFFIIATLFVRHTVAEMRHDSGVQMDRLGIVSLNFDTQRWSESRARRVLDRVLEDARQDPAIEAVAVSAGLPFGMPGRLSVALGTPDKPIGAGQDATAAIAATPTVFRALGVPIVRGRGFDDRDHAGAAPVVVLTEHAARRLFGTVDAVGSPIFLRRLRRADERGSVETAIVSATVVGVARDTDTSRFFGRRSDLVYLPFSQHYAPYIAVTARAKGDPAAAVRALRSAVRRADTDLAIESSGSGRAMMAPEYMVLRGAGIGSLSLGALTLVLAMLGLFGIQTHMVERRTREIGVRMSLGATAAQVRSMVLKDGYKPVLQGLAIGLFIGVAGRTIVRSYLDVKVEIIDPWMLLVVPVPLLLAAFCACYLPARRASKVDPNVALRHL
jgi:putative ABC transport system permease protein